MNQSIPEDLVRYVEEHILPQYYGFDKAHRLDHAARVIEESLQLAALYKADLSMAYVIAAYHDTGLCEGRELHHLVSGKILAEDACLRQWFTPEQLQVMKEAVEDHRASCDHEPRSLYGKIVAEADRIIDPEITLRRTVQYGLSHYPELTAEEQYARFKEHLTVKYGPNGYLQLWIPESSNAARLAEFRKILADEEQLRSTFRRFYEAEQQAASANAR